MSSYGLTGLAVSVMIPAVAELALADVSRGRRSAKLATGRECSLRPLPSMGRSLRNPVRAVETVVQGLRRLAVPTETNAMKTRLNL